MPRVLAAAVMTLLCAAPTFGQPKEEKPKEKSGDPIEKIDPSVDRSITGFVEQIEAKDASNGKVTVRSSGPAKGSPYQYIFQVDEGKTKLQDAKKDLLSDGLKSRLLKDAEVRVEFVDEKRNDAGPAAPGVHFARRIQIIQAKK